MIAHMRMRAPAKRDGDQNRLVPLINVVFLMLIFFLMVGTIRPTEPLSLQPPASSVADEHRIGALQLWVSSAGDLHINGRSLPAQGPGLEQAIRASWSSESVGRNLEIRADRQLAVRTLNRILRAAGDAGAGQIKLITRRQ